VSLKARLKKAETASQKIKKSVKEVSEKKREGYLSLVSECAFGHWEACLKYAKGIDKREHDELWNCTNEEEKDVLLTVLQDKQPERTIIKDLGARYDVDVFNDNVQKAYSYLDAMEKGEHVDLPEIEDLLNMSGLLYALWPERIEKDSYVKLYQKQKEARKNL